MDYIGELFRHSPAEHHGISLLAAIGAASIAKLLGWLAGKLGWSWNRWRTIREARERRHRLRLAWALGSTAAANLQTIDRIQARSRVAFLTRRLAFSSSPRAYYAFWTSISALEAAMYDLRAFKDDHEFHSGTSRIWRSLAIALVAKELEDSMKEVRAALLELELLVKQELRLKAEVTRLWASAKGESLVE